MIWELETKMRRGERLQEVDLAIARMHLQSLELKERVVAYELILYNGKPDELEGIIPLLEKDCSEIVESKKKYPATLLLVLRRLPWPSVAGSSTLKKFILSAAADGGTGARMNSILLLEKFARAGDSIAMEALTSRISDDDEKVRENANWSLARIRGGDSAERH
jgi:hypothetical protein